MIHAGGALPHFTVEKPEAKDRELAPNHTGGGGGGGQLSNSLLVVTCDSFVLFLTTGQLFAPSKQVCALQV